MRLACVILLAVAACGDPAGPTKVQPGDRGTFGDPVRGDSITGDPITGDPIAGDPIAGDPIAGDPIAGDPIAGDSIAGDPIAGDPIAGDPGACPIGHACNPIQISGFPFIDNTRDTTSATSSAIDSYACAPAIDESGAEFFYSLTLNEPGLVHVRVTDEFGDDVDPHLLSAANGSACLARHDSALGRFLQAGTYLLVIDTWVSDTEPLPGPYTLRVNFFPTGAGVCAMTPQDVEMVWDECEPELDCRDEAGERWLRTPAFGPVVLEDHLVTVDDDFAGGWPQSSTDGIAAHYVLSAAATGYVATRTQPWAPAGEGGSEWGQAAVGSYLPVLAEAWYVNMYWQDRPAQGTRILVINPDDGRAVVAAGGYETGPGANTAIGGAVEEIHDYLGTIHRDALVFGFLINDTLPYGPVDCGW